MAIVLRNIDQIFKSDGSEFSSGGGMELGIQANKTGSDTDYNFGAAPVSSITEMDTSSLPAGSTLMWDGTAWQTSGLIIESI
jgi:hypothetical protein